MLRVATPRRRYGRRSRGCRDVQGGATRWPAENGVEMYAVELEARLLLRDQVGFTNTSNGGQVYKGEERGL